jgi:acetyltransferase-like isoleucine patch superfamily enzyme
MNRILYKMMRKLIFDLMHKKKKDYDRFLSISDYFFDRWERAKMMGFGEGTSVYDSCLIIGDVKVGKNVWIGPYTILDGSGGLAIGDNCDICAGVHIYTHNTVQRVINNTEIEKAPVFIENNVYIGPNTVISMGCHLGSRVVIGANSFVNKDVPSNTKSFGTPVRLIGKWPPPPPRRAGYYDIAIFSIIRRDYRRG